jgi:protein tyrosine/serine phosphatase
LTIQESGNFHTLIPDVAYRSGQLDRDGFEKKISAYNIRSVLNLRGSSKSTWYSDEMETMREFGVTHFDHKFSATRHVSTAELLDILKIIEQAPKPILIHCDGGADRTGLFSAITRLTLEKTTILEAKKELSLRYGHFPYLWWSYAKAMDESFDSFTKNMRQIQQ